jgi:enamine deaminase RidA (YjgF/YER057c/UK114 family)
VRPGALALFPSRASPVAFWTRCSTSLGPQSNPCSKNRPLPAAILPVIALHRSLAGIVLGVAWLFATPAGAQSVIAPDSVRFYERSGSAIPGGVVIPAGRAFVWTSGTAPAVFNDAAAPGTRERFGDTRIQATGALNRIDDQLRALGLSLNNVVYLRVYLVPDPELHAIDTVGWDAAYKDFFGTESIPGRPARSVVGVVALEDPDWLVELEAFAIYPP